MDETLIEQQVNEFAAELEVWDDYCDGKASPEAVDTWYELVVAGLDGDKLLESVHRHVTIMQASSSNPKLYYQHLVMLGSVADEIERRRKAVDTDDE